MSGENKPEYEDPDAIVISLAATSPAPLPMQGPDADTSGITIVPPWVSWKRHLPQKRHTGLLLRKVGID